MKKNIGTYDRIIRIVIALSIAGLYFGGMISGLTATVLGSLAIIFLATSFMGFCPIYWGAKVNTLLNKFSHDKK